MKTITREQKDNIMKKSVKFYLDQNNVQANTMHLMKPVFFS